MIRIVFYTSIIFLIGCSQHEMDERNSMKIKVYEQTIYPVLDSIIDELPANTSFIYFENFIYDSTKYWTIDEYLNSKNVGIKKRKMAQNLYLQLEKDPHGLKEIEVIEGENFIVVLNEIVVDSLYKYNESSIFGFFNLSEIVFDENYENACYYISPNLGAYGGGAYVVFLKLKGSNWIIDEVNTVFVADISNHG